MFPFAQAVGSAVIELMQRMIAAGPRVVGHLTLALFCLLVAAGMAALAAIFSARLVVEVAVIALLALTLLMVLAVLSDLLRHQRAARPDLQALPDRDEPA